MGAANTAFCGMIAAMASAAPVIGITMDVRELPPDAAVGCGAGRFRYESGGAYAQAVARAGGVPLLLPPSVEGIERYLSICNGFIFTGGGDVRTEDFGQPTHPQAQVMASQRQRFELALLGQVQQRPKVPVLGICLGMQLMALAAGGSLHQHLPEVVVAPHLHQQDHRHDVLLLQSDSVLTRDLHASSKEQAKPAPPAGRPCPVVSWHHQAVAKPGTLRVVARAADGVIEAVDDPQRPFYLGVQWHPERGGAGSLNDDLFRRLIAACRG